MKRFWILILLAAVLIAAVNPDTIEFIRGGHVAGQIDYNYHTLELRSNPNDFDQSSISLLAYPHNFPTRRAELNIYGATDPNLLFFAGGNVALNASGGAFSAVNYGLNYANAHLTYKNTAGNLVTAGHPAADNAWVTAPLALGWTNYGGGYSTAAYRYTATGEVAMKGNVIIVSKMPTGHALILPVAYRPSEIMTFSADGGRVEIWPNGEVIPIGAGRVSFDGIRFYPSNN
jgi:hypothetical protein